MARAWYITRIKKPEGEDIRNPTPVIVASIVETFLTRENVFKAIREKTPTGTALLKLPYLHGRLGMFEDFGVELTDWYLYCIPSEEEIAEAQITPAERVQSVTDSIGAMARSMNSLQNSWSNFNFDAWAELTNQVYTRRIVVRENGQENDLSVYRVR